MKQVKKILLYICWFILMILAIGAIWGQIVFENYMIIQDQKYGVLKGQKRVSYMPVVAYFPKGVIFKGSNLLDRQISTCIYNGLGEEIISTGAKDEYMVNCYFREEEKIMIKEQCIKIRRGIVK